jgi:hypothetical protein
MGNRGGQIQVTGLRETVRSLKELGEDITPIKDANIEAANMLIGAANPLVPVRSGALLASLKPSRTTMYAEARAGSARVPYAGPIHWGWFMDKKTGRRRNIRPQPFFIQALKLTYAQIIDTYEKNMDKAIKKHNLD